MTEFTEYYLCINNSHLTETITIGKLYKGLYYEGYIKTINNFGNRQDFYAFRFKQLKGALVELLYE